MLQRVSQDERVDTGEKLWQPFTLHKLWVRARMLLLLAHVQVCELHTYL